MPCRASFNVLLYAAEGDAWLGKPPLRATVRVLDMAFFRKIITRHDTGLGEAYMDEDYEVGNPLSHLFLGTLLVP